MDSRVPLAKLLFDGLMYSKQKRQGRGKKEKSYYMLIIRDRNTLSLYLLYGFQHKPRQKKNMPLKCQNNYSVERKKGGG